uniref:Uncharacterized protein MANES_11G078900 n=1 Tax=Rhizophora mucronata TaxID=61149 RepID=A0A2P2LB81_RHIMU
MAKPATTTLLVAVVAFFFFLVSASLSVASNADAPFIVAHKKASLNRLKSGAERVSVSIDIYNQGASSVFLLSLSLIRLDLIRPFCAYQVPFFFC